MEASRAIRHVMQANRSTDTKPELIVRAGLRAAGLAGYRLHWKKAPGHPDVCYPGRQIAIFVNGCYWHHCARCALPTPKSNTAFWEAKFARNRSRDKRVCEELVALGWTVLVVWECQLKGERRSRTLEALTRAVLNASDVSHTRQGRVIEVAGLGSWHLREARRRLARRR